MGEGLPSVSATWYCLLQFIIYEIWRPRGLIYYSPSDVAAKEEEEEVLEDLGLGGRPNQADYNI